MPGEDIEAWVARVRGRGRRGECARCRRSALKPASRWTATFRFPPLRPETEGAAEALARRLTGDNGTHVVSYGTEAGQFQAEGYSAVVCGPGDIAQAHQADEFIELSEFEAGHAFMQRLVAGLA